MSPCYSHFYPSFVGILSVVLALQDLVNDYDVFAVDNTLPLSPAFDYSGSDNTFLNPCLDDSGSNFDCTWNLNDEVLAGGENFLLASDEGSDELFPLLDDENENNLFLAEGCPSSDTGTLKPRDDNMPALCPTNDFVVPELPLNLNELKGQLPTNEDRNKRPSLVPGSKYPSPLPLTSSDEKDPNCPPWRPYRLCCLCDPNLDGSICTDCLLGRVFNF